MVLLANDRVRGANPAENYELYFVPSIGLPVAKGLLEAADLQPGERVLDVACGTGVVARLAAKAVGAKGKVTAVDLNPAMLAVARSKDSQGAAIEWVQSDASSLPLGDETFDVALCQMGLQFMPDKAAALSQMRRVLVAGSRALVNVPGPAPEPLAILADALARHLSKEAAGFVEVVFSLHDGDRLAGLMSDAGFRDVAVRSQTVPLHLPPPADFLWQYVLSTPLAEPMAKLDESGREALERDVTAKWRAFGGEEGMDAAVRIATATGVK